MNYLELLIGNPSFADLDLDSSFNIALQYSIADIKDVSKRNSSYSKTIILPGTKNNNYWLGNLFDINSDFSAFNPNKKTAARLLVNTETVIDGFLQLKKIKKLVNTNHQGNNIQYEVVIFDNKVDLMTELGEKGINELDFSRFEHEFNRQNIIDSWNHTWEDGYVYPMYGKNKLNNVYKVENFYPAIFYKQVLDQTLREAGYGWTGSLVDNKQFEKEIIAYTGEAQPKVSLAEIERRKFRVGMKNATSFTGMITTLFQANCAISGCPTLIMPFNDVTTPPNFDNAGAFDITTNQWVSDRNGEVSFAYSVRYKFSIFNNISNTIFTEFTTGFSFEHRLEFFENGQWLIWPDSVLTVNPFLPGNNDFFEINTSKDLIISGNKTTGSNNVYIGTPVRMRLIVKKSLGNFYEDFGAIPVSLPFELSIPNTADNFLINTPAVISIGQNDTVDFTTVLSDKVKQKDVISDLIKRYNLFIQVDPDNPNLLILDSRNDFYESGEVLDWTEKKDYSSEDNIELMSELQFKTLLLSWKSDNDEYNEFYTQQTGDIYGQFKFTFDNDFVKGEKKIESPFSPTPLMKTPFNAIVPSLDPESPKGNPRILYWGGLKSLNPLGVGPGTPWFFTESFSTVLGIPIAIPIAITNGYPYAGHLDDPINPNLDINFGTFKFPMYSGLQNMTNNNMFNQYWFNYVDQIGDGRLVTSKFYLTENDVNYIKNNFNSKIFVLDSYYVVNKIKDYKPMENGVTEVELLKVRDGVKWKETTTLVVLDNPIEPISGLNIGGDTDIGSNNLNMGFDNFMGGNFIGPDGIETVLSSVVVGNRNQVIGGSVFGDKNIVTEKSFVIGDNNILETDKSLVLIGDNNNVKENGLVIDGFNNVIESSGGNVYKGDNNIINESNISLISSFGITASVKDSVYLGNKTRIGVFDGRIDGVDIKFEGNTKTFNGSLETLEDVSYTTPVNRDNLFYDDFSEKWTIGKRDFINFFDFSSESTTNLTQNVWEPLVVVAEVGFSNTNFFFKTDGSIIWGGPVGAGGEISLADIGERIFKLELILSGSSGNNNEIHAAFFKNGNLWPCSEQSVVTSAAGRANNIPVQCLVNVVPGDELQVYIKNTTSNSDFDLTNVNVIVTEY